MAHKRNPKWGTRYSLVLILSIMNANKKKGRQTWQPFFLVIESNLVTRILY